jgi:hypothetical protein
LRRPAPARRGLKLGELFEPLRRSPRPEFTDRDKLIAGARNARCHVRALDRIERQQPAYFGELPYSPCSRSPESVVLAISTPAPCV